LPEKHLRAAHAWVDQRFAHLLPGRRRLKISSDSWQNLGPGRSQPFREPGFFSFVVDHALRKRLNEVFENDSE